MREKASVVNSGVTRLEKPAEFPGRLLSNRVGKIHPRAFTWGTRLEEGEQRCKETGEETREEKDREEKTESKTINACWD